MPLSSRPGLHDQDRAGRLPYHGPRDAPQQKEVQTATAAGAHHEDTGVHPFRLVENGLNRIISLEDDFVADHLTGPAGRDKPFEPPFYPPARGFIGWNRLGPRYAGRLGDVHHHDLGTPPFRQEDGESERGPGGGGKIHRDQEARYGGPRRLCRSRRSAGRAACQNRPGGLRQDRFGHAAQPESIQAGPAVSPHHDEPCIDVLGLLQDRICRNAHREPVIDRHLLFLSVTGQASQFEQGARLQRIDGAPFCRRPLLRSGGRLHDVQEREAQVQG